MSFNTFSAAGRLTKDAEVRSKHDGTNFLMFTVAVNGRMKDDESMFFTCFYDNMAAEGILKKGNLVTVSGFLGVGKRAEGQQGQSFPYLAVTDVGILMSSRNNNGSNSGGNRGNYNNNRGGQGNYQNNNYQNRGNSGGGQYNNGGQQYNNAPDNDGSDEQIPF